MVLRWGSDIAVQSLADMVLRRLLERVISDSADVPVSIPLDTFTFRSLRQSVTEFRYQGAATAREG